LIQGRRRRRKMRGCNVFGEDERRRRRYFFNLNL